MAYFSKFQWKDQDITTPASAERLNDLEQRIADAAAISATTGDVSTLQLQISALESSSSTTKYTHTQSSPSAYWYVSHNLGSIPTSLFIRDSDGDEVLGADRIDVDNNNLTLQFSEAISGTVILQG